MKSITTAYRPLPRVLDTELAAGGLGLTSQPRPRLSAQWIVAEDGKLMCQWR